MKLGLGKAAYQPSGPGMVGTEAETEMRNLYFFIQGFPQHTDLDVMVN